MLKKILIGLIIVIVATLILAYKNVNSIIAKAIPQIEATVSQKMGLPVKLGTVDVHIFPSQVLKVAGTKIGGVIEVANLQLDFSLFEILKKNLLINSLTIKDLNLDLRALPKTNSAAKPSQPSGSSPSDKNDSTPFKIELNNFNLINCRITVPYKNKSLTLENLNLETSVRNEQNKFIVPKVNLDFRFAETPFKLDLEGLTLDPSTGAALKNGTISFEEALVTLSSEITTNGSGKFKTNIAINELSKLKNLVQLFEPNLVNLLPQGKLKLDAVIDIANLIPSNIKAKINLDGLNLNISNRDLKNIKGDIDIAGDLTTLDAKSNNFSFDYIKTFKVNFDVTRTGTDMIANKIDIDAFAGKTTVTGNIKNNSAYNFVAKLDSLDLNEVSQLEELKTLPLAGTIKSGNFIINGTLATLLPSISGDVHLIDGKLKGFNLISKLLDALNSIQAVMILFGGSFPPELSSIAANPDTEFKALDTTFKFDGGNIDISALRLLSPQYTMFGDGTIASDKSLNLKSKIVFNPVFSETLCIRSKKLCDLKNSNKEMVFPFVLKGTPPLVVILPDITEISKLTLGTKLKEKAGKLIEKNVKGAAGDLVKGILGF